MFIIIIAEEDTSSEAAQVHGSSVGNKTTLRCDICNYTTKYKSNFKRHLKRHSTCVQLNTVTSPRHVCEWCGLYFKTKYGMKLHVLSIHQKKFRFTCNFCDKGYNGLWSFRGHLSTHTKILKEICDICGSKFQYRKSLLNHKRRSHGDDSMRLQCKKCEMSFACMDSLTQHVKGVHEGQEFKCNLCGKVYRWRSSLSYHKKKFCFKLV